MFKICLFEPEIPQNTGNIARTCAATGSELHIIHPIGFDISEKAVRHAGLDYWKDVKIVEYDSADDFFSKHINDKMYFFSSKGKYDYSSVDYNTDDDIYLCFGKESVGLDENILLSHLDNTLRIPMLDNIRCLNLSNSVAIVLYEALKQQGFKNFKKEGKLSNINKGAING